MLQRVILSALIALAGAAPTVAQPRRPIAIVAAENFYGDIARQIGGGNVAVVSILSNPDQDPHLFEASPSVARSLSSAQVVVLNGAGYDPWMEKLLAAARGADRRVIVAADLMQKHAGDNPHLWYDPATMLAVGNALAEQLAAADPAHQADYQRNLDVFKASVQAIEARVATLHGRLTGVPATATEPVFGYMLDALGMTVRNTRFQIAVMNNAEPSASDIAAFENDLKTRQVRLLIYNSQASSPVAARMERLARAARIPVVGVTETEPAGATYQVWMTRVLDAVDHALPR